MVWKEPGKDKDPWSEDGNKTPDFDKFMSELQQRFSGLFGRRRRRGSNTLLHLWLLPVLAALWLLTGCYVVDAGDRGVEFLLGRYQAVESPGLHWHLPWPLGSRTILQGVEQGADYQRGYHSLLTADGEAVAVEVTVHYQVTDIPQYLFGNADPNGGNAAVDILGNLTDAAVSDAVAAARSDDLLGNRVDGVEAAARALLLQFLQADATGLEVTQLEFTKVGVPAPVSSAYASVHQAEEDARKQADAAQAYATGTLASAHSEADSRVQAAKTYADGLVQQAQGEVAAFDEILPAYRRAPAVTRESLTLATFEEILSRVQRVVIMSKDGHADLYLDKQPVPINPPKPVLKSGGHA